MITLNVNGTAQKIDAPADMPLLWALRDILGLTGTKFGCGIGVCGACTVHMNGEAQRSCVMPVGEVGKARIVTIEKLGEPKLHPVQTAWIERDVPQCGFCQSGMVMQVAALLRTNPKPADADIDVVLTNVCRCGTYPRLRAAIHSAAKALAK